MIRTSQFAAASLAALLATAGVSSAQSAKPRAAHVIVIELVTKGGSYGFAPSTVTAQRGDTLRFVESAGVPHNVHFKTHPSGAKLGSSTVGPYLTAKGQVYNVVLDARFAVGRYTFVCDPHEALGMTGTLTVAPATGTAAK